MSRSLQPLGEYRGCLAHAFCVVAEGLVERRCLANGSVDEVYLPGIGIVEGHDVDLDGPFRFRRESSGD